MLDPSLPWLAQGYKNFETEDVAKTSRSYDDITKLYHINTQDYVKKELRSSTPELHQRRRVKSATYGRHSPNSISSDGRRGRPRSAFVTPVHMEHARSPTRPGSSQSHARSPTRPGSSQSYYREKVGCYDYETEHPPLHSYKPHAVVRPRPKSAIYLRHHRPSSLDRKSVSQVERQFYKERGMHHSLSVDEGENHYCAFCPSKDCKPESSSSTRPTSSTGLVAAMSPSHYDRYTSWTRPRTAPATKREYLQQSRPRHNYVNRTKVPHYTNFIKRIDLGLRDQTPSPPPPPRRRRAFEEPATAPSPPREPRESRARVQVVPVKAAEKPKPPAPPPPPPKPLIVVEPEDVEDEEIVAVLKEAENRETDVPIRIPTPIEPEPQQEDEEIEPPEEVPSAWAEPRAPTPTPTNSPPPEPADEEEEERIPTPPPPREPTPPPPEEPKPSTPPPPEPEPPREPTPPPPEEPPPKEPTPPPSPPPEPEPEPEPPQEMAKPKKEFRFHDPPVVEPIPRAKPQKKEKKPSNLVKRPVAKTPEPKPEPKPELKPTPPVAKPVVEPEVIEEPTPPAPKVEPPPLPEVKEEEVKPEPPELSTPTPPFIPKVEEAPTESGDADPKKKLLGPAPKVKVDVFGRAMDPEYMKYLLDLEMKSRRKGKYDDEDEELIRQYSTSDAIPDSAMKKSKMDSWLKGRMALSKRASRFELPMDVMELEGMNQITYLERYCIVSSRRVALYRKAFNRVDKDCDLKINLKEMEKAIEDALVDTIHLHQIKEVLELIGAKEDIKIRPKLFASICALLERLFYHEFVTEDSLEMDGNTKERVETADFSALDWKLEGCNVNAPLRKLLYKLL